MFCTIVFAESHLRVDIPPPFSLPFPSLIHVLALTITITMTTIIWL